MEQGEPASLIHRKFMDAWDDMYKYVKRLIDAGQMSIRLLETAIWIEVASPDGRQAFMFYDARDMAIDKGWKQPKA
jgi:hypothetical protein